MFEMKNFAKSAFVAAAAAAFFFGAEQRAEAAVITISGGTTTVSAGTLGDGNAASIVGLSIDGFTVDFASTSPNTAAPDLRTLNTTSIQTTGSGVLTITAEEKYTFAPNSFPSLHLSGSGSVTALGDKVTVSHFIDVGAGYQQIGSDIVLTSSPDLGSVQTSMAFADPFSLKTVIVIENSSATQQSNVNGTVTAAVPVPAAGLMLLTGLGGLVAMRRRKKKA